MKTFQNPTLVLLAIIGLGRVSAAETIYFLAELTDGWPIKDSAVIPLSDSNYIAHARYLIAKLPDTSTGVTGTWPNVRVAPGQDGINRNYVRPASPEWSWHVEAVYGFEDATLEELWNTATGVEALYQTNSGYGSSHWVLLENLVRELGPIPVYLSIAPHGQAFEFYWSTPVTNHGYTVEAKDSLGASNWYPVPGASWPIYTNHWILPAREAAAHFYRVKVE